ncbi:hypothetical protein NLX83_15830 [Allokutzneria sp. A3M-2-11 16]|uniref:hypothetical protein n=1 Tax=Allokutzneria sp. A3M-2-11 16 TaxID=2962043 RepID=UPI0020B7C877|nr:hypothetical protein [Allokutzneria sp. A3M-2-11 16]MCP3800737.1 hypothetical protein [Allokutzneria sp. A3M-2-11 16]
MDLQAQCLEETAGQLVGEVREVNGADRQVVEQGWVGRVVDLVFELVKLTL